MQATILFFEVNKMSVASVESTAIALNVGDQAFGLLIGEIHEFIEPIHVAKVPMTHPYFLGLISLRGKVLPLINLAGVFHADHNPFPLEDEKYVICGTGNERIALDIHSVGEPFTFHSEDLVSVNDEKNIIAAKLRLENRELPLLNIGKLLALTKSLNSLERDRIDFSS